MNNEWHHGSRRRYFLDYHIDDWNEKFLSEYDPETYASACKKSGATAATYMANTHSGLLNWPSKQGGTLHPFLKGRDMLQETIDALHRNNLDAIVYYVFVYVVDYWDKHPSARSKMADGTVEKQRVGTREREKRFATCCFNDPGYRRQALAELEELCEKYDFDGIWPDMTFWPNVCYCDNCRSRYKKETGKEIPKIINWKSPDFVRFIRTRQKWLVEFCTEITNIIRTKKPGIKYAQQSQTFVWDWMAGASSELADCWDWMSADLYSNRYGLSYSSKFFYSLSNIKPFERVNCWNYPNIHEHDITRTEKEMKQIAYSTLMNDGALTIIDQIEPTGRLHLKNYQMMEKVFDEIKKYEPYTGGTFKTDVGIYYSFYSNMDMDWNGRSVADSVFTLDPRKWASGEQSETTHMACAESAAKTMTWFHVPYGVVTKKNLAELSNYKVLILPNVALMDEEECEAIRKFVENGGCLYASKETGTVTSDGACKESFLLQDVFGVRLTGKTKEITTYVSPTEAGSHLFQDPYDWEFPLTVHDWQEVVETVSDQAEVIATLTLPYIYPSEDRYASLLTTPPGRFTKSPALVKNRYGKGTVIYSTAELEKGDHISQREVFYRIIRELGGSFCTELENYPSVEITRFEKDGQTMLHVLNYQTELPNIPIHELKIKAALYGKKVVRAVTLPEETELKFTENKDMLEIEIPVLKDYMVIAVEYE